MLSGSEIVQLYYSSTSIAKRDTSKIRQDALETAAIYRFQPILPLVTATLVELLTAMAYPPWKRFAIKVERMQ